ncbi:hypothetical protein EON80_22305 [bacterium]|nr:MAG: hypothetical protein EON80_22305 [bacterium]
MKQHPAFLFDMLCMVLLFLGLRWCPEIAAYAGVPEAAVMFGLALPQILVLARAVTRSVISARRLKNESYACLDSAG